MFIKNRYNINFDIEDSCFKENFYYLDKIF